jgi:hypothetical protein
MNAIPLFTKDGYPTNISYCSVCKLPHIHGIAENCCKKGICKICGKESPSAYNLICYDCRDKEQMDKAEKLENWDGPVCYNDEYFETMDNLIDCKDARDLPEFVYIAETENIPKLDADDILERLCEDLYEDAYEDLNGVDEFEEAIREFNKANERNTYWMESGKRAVRVPKGGK